MSKVSIELSANVGGLVSNMSIAKESVKSLDKEIEKAKKDGDDAKLGQLYFAKGKMETVANGFGRDFNSLIKNPQYQQIMEKQATGQVLSKSEEKFVSTFEKIADSFKKSTEAMVEISKKSANGEDFFKSLPNLEGNAKETHKLVEDQNTPPGMRSMRDAVKAIGIGQITSAINDGFSRWAGSLDRSGIVNQYGSGDILGGRISEQRRQADLWGGIAQSGLGIAGAVAGSLIPGVGTILGGTLGAAGGKAIDTLLHTGPDKEATAAAYAGLWQNRSGEAMELAALLDSVNDVRGAFKTAADVAAEFGYSAEEGMDAIKQAAMQGLEGKEAADLAGRAFDYERRTGADRGTLQGISAMSARYGAGDALGVGWAGLQASGMKQGQYSEYLRAMQRVMEDGISKGFVRSSEQVARSLTMLSQMTGNNPLWQGENGARRISEMNAGLEGTTGLQSTTDIVAFQAARNIAEKRNGGKPVSYVEAMKVLEEGFNAEIFKEIMDLTSKYEGGNYEAMIERMIKTFDLKYITADALHKGYDPNSSLDELQKLIDKNKNTEPPPPNNPEFDFAKQIEEIKKIMNETGQSYWDEQMKNLPEELARVLREFNEQKAKNEPFLPADTSGMSPTEATRVRQQEYIDALESGNKERIDQAFVAMEKANMDALNPMPSISDPENLMRMETQALSSLSGLFSPGLALNPFKSDAQKEDRSSMNQINDTVSSAIYSGNTAQIQEAKDVLDMFSKLPMDIRKDWDKNNTANGLANSDGIAGIRSDLQKLIEVEIENGRLNLTVEEDTR